MISMPPPPLSHNRPRVNFACLIIPPSDFLVDHPIMVQSRQLAERLGRHWGGDAGNASRLKEKETHGDETADAPDGDPEDCDDLEVRTVWNSSTHKAKSTSPTPSHQAPEQVRQLKTEGNSAFREGRPDDAVRLYSRALDQLRLRQPSGSSSSSKATQGGQDEQKDNAATEAVLLNNRAAALLQLKQFPKALADAGQAAQLCEGWSKPYHLMARVHLARGEYQQAMQDARHGESLSKKENGILSEQFTPLIDKIAMTAALNGSLVGFDGRLLMVRSAGDDAWMGKEAPHDPLLDGPIKTDAAIPEVVKRLEVVEGGVHAEGHRISSNEERRVVASKPRVMFRSLQEAVEAAEDGDRILLLRGIHNGLATTVEVSKRLLVSGEGALEEAVFDFRGNVPAIRVTRCAVLQNLFVDFSGYCTAIKVVGAAAAVQPFLDNCKIICTGDDAVDVGGRTAPVLRDCYLKGEKKCGLRCWDQSRPVLMDCVIEGCGQQGVKVFDQSSPLLEQAQIRDCRAEGVVAMGRSAPRLKGCVIERNAGPGIDLSCTAKATIDSCIVEDNVGGLWGWNSSFADVRNSKVEGGTSFAVLMDEDASLRCSSGVHINGGIQATDLAWGGMAREATGTIIRNTDVQADLPRPAPPFVFVPSEFSRGM